MQQTQEIMARAGRSYPASLRKQSYERTMPGSPPLPDGPPPPLKGFEPPSGRSSRLVSDGDIRQRALMSWAALRRQITLGAGPISDRWSTNPGDGLTPQKITEARRLAHAGYPWVWADMCEQEIERSSTIKSRFDFRRAWAHQIPYRVDAPDHFRNDKLADMMACWATAVINRLRNCWPNAVHNLLSASAYGYAACEVFWDFRDVAFTYEGDEYVVKDCLIPVHLKEAHQKHFCFDIDSDQPLLWTGQGRPGVPWPKGKYIFHQALGDGITERRGFMTAAMWVSLALQSGWRDLMVFMHLYGLPQFALLVEKEILDQDEERAIIDEAMLHYGQGKIPIWLKDMEVEPLGQVSGDPIHPMVINLAKEDLSVLITGSTLTQTQGTGTGSYNMHEGHAITAHMYRVPDGVSLDRAIGECVMGPMVEFNIDQLVRALSSAGADASRVRQRVSWFGWKAVGPAPTVADHIGNYKGLASVGFPVSVVEMSQRTGYGIGQGEDRLKGTETTIPEGAKTIGNIEAAHGAEGNPRPKPQKTSAPAQESK